MSGLAITDRWIEKYIKSLSKLDINARKKLIIRLTESIDSKSDAIFDLKAIYGAWEDSRDLDEIIKQIMESRVNYPNTEEL